MCGRAFNSGTDVRGSVAVYSSHGSVIYGDVCDGCAKAVAALLAERYPAGNPLVRLHEPPVQAAACKDRDCRRCVRCAQDEDSATEAAS